MSRLIATLKLDARLQLRSKLYHIGIVVSVLLGLIVRFLFSADQVGIAIPSFYLLGLGGTTFMFVAGMVLFEKSERTLAALRTSPLLTRDYIASKALTLTAFAVVESLIVLGIAGQGADFAPLPLMAGLLGMGLGYTLIGLGMVASHDSVTTFLFPDALLVVTVLQLAFLSVFDVGPTLLYYVIPLQGPFVLMLGAFSPIETWQWVYGVVMTLALIVGSYTFTRVRFRTHMGLQEG